MVINDREKEKKGVGYKDYWEKVTIFKKEGSFIELTFEDPKKVV